MSEKNGMNQNGINQNHAAKSDPRIGLITFLAVFDVSMSPSPAVIRSSSPLNKSPINGITTGAAPAEPIPCSTRPAKIMG